MAIIQWIYAAKAATPLTVQELDAVLRKDRARYLDNSLTGLHIYARQRWLGILEGIESEIIAMQTVLERDHTHTGITHFRFHEKATREFSHWAMSYVRQGPDRPEGFVPLTPENPFKELISSQTDAAYYVSRFWASAFTVSDPMKTGHKVSPNNVA